MDVRKVLFGLGLSLVLNNGVASVPECGLAEGDTIRWVHEWHNCIGDFFFGKGLYMRGKLNGQGTKTWANGDKYVGEYKDDLKSGQGTHSYADGSVKEGIWKDDLFRGTIAEWERVEKKRIAKQKQEQLARQKKREKYKKIYTACLLDKSSSVDMQVYSVESAVKETCKSIATKPSWLEKLRYD